jgi:hypothetical protein
MMETQTNWKSTMLLLDMSTLQEGAVMAVEE